MIKPSNIEIVGYGSDAQCIECEKYGGFLNRYKKMPNLNLVYDHKACIKNELLVIGLVKESIFKEFVLENSVEFMEFYNKFAMKRIVVCNDRGMQTKAMILWTLEEVLQTDDLGRKQCNTGVFAGNCCDIFLEYIEKNSCERNNDFVTKRDKLHELQKKECDMNVMSLQENIFRHNLYRGPNPIYQIN